MRLSEPPIRGGATRSLGSASCSSWPAPCASPHHPSRTYGASLLRCESSAPSSCSSRSLCPSCFLCPLSDLSFMYRLFMVLGMPWRRWAARRAAVSVVSRDSLLPVRCHALRAHPISSNLVYISLSYRAVSAPFASKSHFPPVDEDCARLRPSHPLCGPVPEQLGGPSAQSIKPTVESTTTEPFGMPSKQDAYVFGTPPVRVPPLYGFGHVKVAREVGREDAREPLEHACVAHRIAPYALEAAIVQEEVGSRSLVGALGTA